MSIALYIAFYVASSCIVVLTISFLVAAVYVNARVSSIEKQVTQLHGDLSGLIHDSQGFVMKMQQVAVRASGTMADVRQMTRTAARWTDRADRMLDVATTVTSPSLQRVSKYLKFGGGFLHGVMQALRTQGNKS